jgi:hypothetical protein
MRQGHFSSARQQLRTDVLCIALPDIRWLHVSAKAVGVAAAAAAAPLPAQVLLRRTPGEIPELYLGLLYPTEEYRVYGYISNTHIKFVLVLDEAAPREDELKRLFKRIHYLFVDVTSNPLYTHGLPITSRKFDEGTVAILKTYGS